VSSRWSADVAGARDPVRGRHALMRRRNDDGWL
jgi:hypothetical protein